MTPKALHTRIDPRIPDMTTEQIEFVDALVAPPMEMSPTMSLGVLPIFGKATAGRVCRF